MSKYTMRIIIEFIVHLYDNFFRIIECDLSYLLFVFYAEYLYMLLQGLYFVLRINLIQCNSVMFVSNQQHCENTTSPTKSSYIPFIKMIFNLIC